MRDIRVVITGPELSGRGGVASYYSGILPCLEELPGLEVHYHPLGGHAPGGRVGHWIKDQINIYRIFQKYKPELVMINPSLGLKGFIRDGLVILSAKSNSGKVVVFFRGWNMAFELVVERYLSHLFRLIYGKADAFIVLASHFEHKLRSWGISSPIVRETTAVAQPVFVDTSQVLKMRGGFTTNGLKVIFLSRLEKDKGVYETMEAVLSLAHAGFPITLTVVGDGSESGNIRRWIMDREADEIVTISGYLDGEKKKEALLSHDVFCFPTQHGEGMPNSVLEAMANGLVVITTCCGGLKDFFEVNKMGFFVQPKNVDDIISCLKVLLNDKKICADMGIYNHHYAKKCFAAPIVAGRIHKIVKELMK